MDLGLRRSEMQMEMDRKCGNMTRDLMDNGGNSCKGVYD